MGGADVERYCREGRIAEVAAYCETDVVNTYRVWLRYELFRGRLTENGLQGLRLVRSPRSLVSIHAFMRAADNATKRREVARADDHRRLWRLERGACVRLWKVELQNLADETGLVIHVHHYPRHIEVEQD